jgi:hypothetical protein
MFKMFCPIVAWKFDVELPQPDGGALARLCYVRLPDRDLAVKALLNAYPNAKFMLRKGKSLSSEQAHEAFGQSVEVVLCVSAGD